MVGGLRFLVGTFGKNNSYFFESHVTVLHILLVIWIENSSHHSCNMSVSTKKDK